MRYTTSVRGALNHFVLKLQHGDGYAISILNFSSKEQLLNVTGLQETWVILIKKNTEPQIIFKIFFRWFFVYRVQTGSGAHPASYPMCIRGYFPGDKAAGS
jgi:hypothetical protein